MVPVTDAMILNQVKKQAADFITHEVDSHKKRDSKEVEGRWK